LERGALKVK